MASEGFKVDPGWHWPDNTGSAPDTTGTQDGPQVPGAFEEESNAASTRFPKPPEQSHSKFQTKSTPKRRKHWPPRTCRICLETVQPTFHTPSDTLPEMLQPAPNVTYESSDPEAGRLLRPCKCKGSSKYVHEACLQAWRHADPGYGKRNYWQCPTCGFKYRLKRMTWGRWISSTSTQIVLTVAIFLLALFFMGFVADPIINFYAEPYSIFTSPRTLKTKIEPIFTDDDVPTWTEHFVKGLASLGLLGFVKVLVTLSPWNWLNVRGSGIMGGTGRSGNTGRDRLANISWLVVLIGVFTFLWAVYKGVRAWSRRTLEKASEKVMDVVGDGDDDDEDDDEK
ncbi:MAG: hypothetical protein Q9217_000798 [Psora testacea]